MTRKIVLIGFLAAFVFFAACKKDEPAQEVEESDQKLELNGKSLMLYPLALDVSGESENYDFDTSIAAVIGMFLERAGMNPEISEDYVNITPADSLAVMEDKIQKYQDWRKINTDYTLFVTFRGKVTEKGRILDRTRIVLANPEGTTIWSREDTTFPDGPPDNPMAACVHVARSLRSVSDLLDFERPDAQAPKMEELIAARSAVPPNEELEAMRERWKIARPAIKQATITVYPVHVWGQDEYSMESAQAVVEGINESGLGKASATKIEPQIYVRGSTNELKVLWDIARAFRNYLRENPAGTDYALLIDVGAPPRVSHVHMILCEGRGEWVMVDLENSHHSDFQQINPDSLEDCVNLAVLRWQKRVQDLD